MPKLRPEEPRKRLVAGRKEAENKEFNGNRPEHPQGCAIQGEELYSQSSSSIRCSRSSAALRESEPATPPGRSQGSSWKLGHPESILADAAKIKGKSQLKNWPAIHRLPFAFRKFFAWGSLNGQLALQAKCGVGSRPAGYYTACQDWQKRAPALYEILHQPKHHLFASRASLPRHH